MEPGSDRLDSWKEIAAYFRRDESTVRRWEKDGLPVHRHKHKAKASVFAYRAELDAWWKNEPALREAPGPTTALRQSSRTRWFMAAGFLTLLLAAGGMLMLRSRPRAAPTMAMKLFLSSEGELTYPAFSPDGKQLAFTWVNPAQPSMEIYVKALGSEAPARVTRGGKGVEDFSPTWSPDGSQIAFLRGSADAAGIYLVPSRGGAERKILDLRPDRYYALDWSADGKHIAFAKRETAVDPYCVYLLSPADGAQRQVTFPAKQTFGDLRFSISPDGKRLAFIRHSGKTQPQVSIGVTSLDKPEKAEVVAHYQEWIGGLAWSADGGSLILSGNVQGVRKLWRLSLTDRREQPLNEAGENVYYPTVARSNDGLAFVREIEDADLWRVELSATHVSAPVRVNFSTRVEGAPRFSPDGKRIAFLSYRSGLPELWVSEPDGEKAVRITSFGTAGPEFPNWSPDGQTLVFAGGGAYLLVRATGGQPQQLSAEMTNITFPAWSRDGKSIYACRKGQGGGPEIWKAPVAGGPASFVVKNGMAAMESPDGKFLYYTNGMGIWRMPTTGGEATLVVPKQRPDFPGYWTVVEDGIYFLNADNKPTIEFFRFSTRKSTPVVTLSGLPDPWRGGLTVSPDRRTMVYSQQQYSSFEIVVGEK